MVNQSVHSTKSKEKSKCRERDMPNLKYWTWFFYARTEDKIHLQNASGEDVFSSSRRYYTNRRHDHHYY
jgi:hypothetical protein